jgi:hypothetical protein
VTREPPFSPWPNGGPGCLGAVLAFLAAIVAIVAVLVGAA